LTGVHNRGKVGRFEIPQIGEEEERSGMDGAVACSFGVSGAARSL